MVLWHVLVLALQCGVAALALICGVCRRLQSFYHCAVGCAGLRCVLVHALPEAPTGACAGVRHVLAPVLLCVEYRPLGLRCL